MCAYCVHLNVNVFRVFACGVCICGTTIHIHVSSVSNPGFPEPETRFFGYFLPESRLFFNYQTRVLKKPGIAVAFKC